MSEAAVFSPAKINLFLAVTGRRSDGYHDLVSVAAPLAWGDTLRVRFGAAGGGFSLTCDDPTVPLGEDNLVLRAARAFAAATGWKGSAEFHIEKKIPTEAGLGGGSSNAVAALRALCARVGQPFGVGTGSRIAPDLGSDCALFLAGEPVVMRGRGERVDSLPAGAAARLRRRRLLIFKPGFGIPTAWAYARLAEMAAAGRPAYQKPEEAEARLAAWIDQAAAQAEQLLFNALELPAFSKYPALPALFEKLRSEFGLAPLLSGSGSACFALLPETGGPAFKDLNEAIRDAWGATSLVAETKIA